jgi:hypothetical protein
MQLRYAMLADYANVTQDGKLNIVGVFDNLYALSFPAVHRQLFLVNSIEADNEDEGQTREVKIQMINADGEVLHELKGHFAFGHGKQTVNQIHLFHDLRFDAPGPYQFNIFFSEHHVKTLDLELMQVEQS